MSVQAARIRPGPADPRAHAWKIAGLVTETWYGRHGTGRLEVPLSVVAALSLLGPPYAERREFAGELMSLNADEFAAVVRHLWHSFIRMRPDLVNRVWLLVEPWEGLSREAVQAAKAVGDAALRLDQFGLTGTEARFEVDLLGVVLTQLRPKAALQSRGQYYTPTGVSDLMAQMLDIQEGRSIHEPCVATGGNFRAAAWAMRSAGRDPATCTWVGVDIDALAVACCAVNVVVWGLGPNVLLGVGDALLDDWWERAVAERRETLAIAQAGWMMAALRALGLAADPGPAEASESSTADQPNPARAHAAAADPQPAGDGPE